MANTMQEALQNAGLINEHGEINLQPGDGSVNVGEVERWASAIGGGALALYGLARGFQRGAWDGFVLALVGGALVYRGVSGHCDLYQAIGVNTAGTDGETKRSPVVSVPANRGTKVEKSVTINKSPAELYQFWRNLENLPHFMSHLESVQVTDEKRSHWIAKAPAGSTVEWDAEIYNEKENELIAWRSLEGSDVDNAGSVHFEAAPGGRGTVVRVVLKYDPPAGRIGSTLAKLFGEEPSQQIDEDLRRFKQLMEAGEAATTEGQPSGRSAKAGK
ncbi:MAG TPA: SRPBCC family protein [Pyrinomonadaceae bacterium]|nr:SRPBCC family protein [Pyrinomonadaceae bacterium]